MGKIRLRAELLETRETPTVLPPGFTESVVTTGLTQPVAMTLAPDGRLFVTEQGGTLRIISAEGKLLEQPFLTVNVDSTVERGLLGVALDPDFAANNYLYVYYTVPEAEGQSPFNRISRFTANGDTAVPGSEHVLADLDPLLGAGNHNGGALHFGADGKLYVAVGDATDPLNSQSLANRHGKILRYNPDGTIPEDNPRTFDGLPGETEGANRAIWAVGLRNPFTFAVQPGTGRIYVNDVGASKAEEVNEILPGKNYGFPYTEGDFDQSKFPHYTRPLTTIPRGDVADDFVVAIAGGAFYNPELATFPADYAGDYFFGDFASRFIRRYDPATGAVETFATDMTGIGLVDLDVTPQGDLLYLAWWTPQPGNGGVYRIRASQAPEIARHPADASVEPGEPATFSVVASGTPALNYQWQKNGVDIPGATAATLTVSDPQVGDNGARFRAVVRNEFGTVASHEAVLTVTSNQPPVPVILTPAAGDKFIAGQVVGFSGTATDPEDGALAAAAFTWRVEYITGSAPPRPLVPDTSGITSGTFTIPTLTPYTLPDVLYRVMLTVRDSAGRATTVTRDIHPVTADVTLAAGVAGVTLFLDGQPHPAPYTFTGVAGLERRLGAPTVVPVGSEEWVFTGWADGDRNAQRVISSPTEAATFTALYAPRPPARLLVGVDRMPAPPAKLIALETGAVTESETDLGDEFAGGVRVATGDVTGDGVPDFVYGAGPGRGSTVAVVDGATNQLLQRFEAFEPGFTGGVFVALADINGDRLADVIVSPDVGGGPRVRVLRVSDLAVIADFFGIEDPAFRGGASVAAGDVTGDGRADLIVAAGYGGGPRVAGWDGAALAAGALEHAFVDFFAFEPTLRTGLNVAAGDINGDGRADVFVGGARESGPRVMVLSGAHLANNEQLVFGNFFAGDPAGRTGVRVAARDLNGDGLADVAAGLTGVVRGYVGGALPLEGTPDPFREWGDFGESFTGSVYVG